MKVCEGAHKGQTEREHVRQGPHRVQNITDC